MDEPRLDKYGFPIPEDQWGSEPAPGDRRGRGCLFYGCLTLALGLGLALLALVALTYIGLRQIRESFTAAEAADIPVVELPDAEAARLEQRLAEFQRAADAGDQGEANDAPADEPPARLVPPPRELALTAQEINALLAMQPELRGRVFVRIEDGRIGGDVSLPLDELPMGAGRFLNARVEFAVAAPEGELDVRLTDVEVNGVRPPETVLDRLGAQNLLEGTSDDAKLRSFSTAFESVRVEGDRLILRLAPQGPTGAAPQGAEPPAAEIETFEDPMPVE